MAAGVMEQNRNFFHVVVPAAIKVMMAEYRRQDAIDLAVRRVGPPIYLAGASLDGLRLSPAYVAAVRREFNHITEGET